MALGESVSYGYTPGDMNHANSVSDHPTTTPPPAAGTSAEHDAALAERLRSRLRGGLPAHLGMELVEIPAGGMVLQMPVRAEHGAANGYLHAGAVVSLADTACGFGCLAHLPPGANNFTTIELKSNFLSTTLEGVIIARATLRHAGRRTQIWDAEVHTAELSQTAKSDATQSGAVQPGATESRLLVLFRCTQMILYPS